MKKLFISYEGEIIGEITPLPNNVLRFKYDDLWLQSGSTFPLSPSIRKTKEAYEDVSSFFSNLLPEGRALDDLSRFSQISKSHLTGLLLHIGQDISGALEIHSSIESVNENHSSPSPPEALSDSQINERINDRLSMPLSIWGNKVRFSIAGYQDKMTVYKDAKGNMFLPDGNLASTHIIKPNSINPKVGSITANEHFCMNIAHAIKLPVANTQYRFLPEPVLEIERFDRTSNYQDLNRPVKRLHVVDACQALDLPVSYKMERIYGNNRDVKDIREGVSFPKLFDLADTTNSPVATKIELLNWALFNYTVGNSDAHGKNISFYMKPEGLELAPFYDLVSTEVYEDIEETLAMAINDEFIPANVTNHDWIALADDADIPLSILHKALVQYGLKIKSASTEELLNPIYSDDDLTILTQINEIIEQRCEKLLCFSDEVKDHLKPIRPK